ncbi:hypothetical protein HYQ46_001943 [Verticillium longisporum]|nr:hypothetical protein HYQ46_001943 [Verticillium longisporum]
MSARTMDRFWSTWMSKYKKVDERCCPLMIDDIDRAIYTEPQSYRNIHMSDESLSPRSITILIIPQPRDFS